MILEKQGGWDFSLVFGFLLSQEVLGRSPGVAELFFLESKFPSMPNFVFSKYRQQ